MLAISRALMSRPQLLVLDEPSMGLAPMVTRDIFAIVIELKQEGRTILLIEQNARAALNIADRGYVIETGKVVLEGEGHQLLEHKEVKRAYSAVAPSRYGKREAAPGQAAWTKRLEVFGPNTD